MKSKILLILKRVVKPVGYCLLATIVIIFTFLYGRDYLVGGENLTFTPEDRFLLFVYFIGVVLVSIILVYLVTKIAKLEYTILEMYGYITDVEDSNVRLTRQTQEIIIDLCGGKDMGDKNEKKSSI